MCAVRGRFLLPSIAAVSPPPPFGTPRGGSISSALASSTAVLSDASYLRRGEGESALRNLRVVKASVSSLLSPLPSPFSLHSPSCYLSFSVFLSSPSFLLPSCSFLLPQVPEGDLSEFCDGHYEKVRGGEGVEGG